MTDPNHFVTGQPVSGSRLADILSMLEAAPYRDPMLEFARIADGHWDT